MLPQYGDGKTWIVCFQTIPLHKLGLLLHYSLSAAGFVTALSDRFRSGGRFPASSVIASILPGLRLFDSR